MSTLKTTCFSKYVNDDDVCSRMDIALVFKMIELVLAFQPEANILHWIKVLCACKGSALVVKLSAVIIAN